MKKRIKNTIEGSFLQMGLGFLIVVAIATIVKFSIDQTKPAKDINQLEEMRNYHASQNRDIILF